MQLKNRVIVITGASNGIGKAIAEKCEGLGATVIKCSRKQGCDITIEPQVRKFFAETIKERRIDVLINNAGVFYKGKLEDQEIKLLKESVMTNVVGTALITKNAIPLLKKAGAPLVINMLSGNAYVAKAGIGAYSATKFALRGLSESWHKELKSEGIRVSSVSPGKVDTRMHKASARELREKMLRPDDVADLVVYLIMQPKHVWIQEVQVRPFLLE